jgi:hypothetical protein
LDSKTVFTKEVARMGNLRQKVVSFAMPGVEPGAILEYRWRQSEDDNRFKYLRLNFARELPVEKVTYFVRPLSSQYIATAQMFMLPFNCAPTPIKLTNDGWNETTVERVPATRDEPYAPSKPNLEAWALLYYREGGSTNAQKFWEDVGKKAYGQMKSSLKAGDELKAAAAKINETSKTEDEKIAAMTAYVRSTLRRFSGPEVTDAERQDLFKKMPNDRDRTSAEILKSGIAFDDELNVVFAALAQQVGFDARPALVADRDEIAFSPGATPDRYFLDNTAMAIKQGDSWKIFDVRHRYLKPGMLPADSEGVLALVTDSKAPAFVTTSVTPPEDSAEKRSAKLSLSADGTLEGDVQETYTGQRAALYRQELSGETLAAQEKFLTDRLVSMFGGAQLSNIKFTDVENPAAPLQMAYHLKVPLFAQVTGRRILFDPIAFRRADAARFTANERRYPIEFRYGWMETDTLRIALPDGFSLENGENPGSLEFGEPGYYKLSLATSGSELVVGRELVFGRKALLRFDAKQYPTLKQIFETVHVRDSMSLSLKGN